MTLKAQMAADAALFLNQEEFAEEVLYTPKDGTAFAVSLLVAPATVKVGGEVVTIDGEVVVILAMADVPAPGAGDTILRENGEAYRLERSSPRSDDGVFWKLRLVRDRLPVLGGR